MVGNIEDATHALNPAAHLMFLLSSHGSTRDVFLINDVVYKVERQSDWVNATEYEVMTTKRLPVGVFYPEVSLYDIDGTEVIAMDYIEGTFIYECFCSLSDDTCDSMCMTEHEREFLIPLLDDPSGLNVVRNEHGYYIIDAA